ncbi:MAG: virB9 [Rickettsiaceae bacterium]|jgi:type IV secretion system protein VirB9|nr:virB9 [Rickettsiaceae bacterium]
MRILLIIYLLFYTQVSQAIREPRPTAVDSRIKVIVYSPDDVFKFTGYYGYQANIEFAKDEEILNISMGDSTSWQVVASGYRLFIKPMEKDATTNMTLITNKRTYFFELYAEEAEDIRDPNMVFSLRFLYPDEEDDENLRKYSTSTVSGPDLSHPEQYNFNYSISGNSAVAPIKIFDDGEFTYMQFRDKNAEMPAFFTVDEDLKESIVNYRLSPDAKYVIIEQVAPKFTIRHGKRIVCVFNEAITSKKKK